jgi:hypothetical protein
MKKTLAILAICAGVLISVAACGGSGNPPPTVKAPVSTSAQPTPTVTKTITVPGPTVRAIAPPNSTVTIRPVITDPGAVVQQFYADISAHDYLAAWNLGGKNLAGGASYDSWVAGYSTTKSIGVSSFNDTGSNTVFADIAATQTDGSFRSYSGTYTVHNGVITSANIKRDS